MTVFQSIMFFLAVSSSYVQLLSVPGESGPGNSSCCKCSPRSQSARKKLICPLEVLLGGSLWSHGSWYFLPLTLIEGPFVLRLS